ncbi:MAG: hypothetical protein ACYDH5_04550 [Acidimicrobiales bacterium]
MDTLGIIRQIEADPALRAQLRAVLLGDELLGLPLAVAANARGIERNAQGIAANAQGIAANAQGIAANAQGIAANARGIAANARGIAKNSEGIAEVRQGVAEVWEGVAANARAIGALRTEVGHLSTVVGGTVEKDAASLIETVLTRRGWQMLEDPRPIEVDGELDVVARALDGDGTEVTAVIEAKTRLRPADVRRFAANIGSLLSAGGVTGRYIPYVYGLLVYSGVDDAAREARIGVLEPEGERVEGAVRS